MAKLAKFLFYDMQSETLTKESWIHMVPYAKIKHPEYGEINFDERLVKDLYSSFIDGVRGTELDIDYDHKEHNGKAAGWIKQAEIRSDGLWGLISWTDEAYNAIQNKEYKYFSPEFWDEWTNPVTGVEHTNVLFGGGITNRPFLKDLQPLSLSEKMFTEKKGTSLMTPEQIAELAKSLGLADTATTEEVFAALVEKLKPADKEESLDEASEAGQGAQQALVGAGATLSENTQVALLQKLLNENQHELAEMRTASTIKQLSELASEKGFALTPVMEDELKVLLSEVNDKKTRNGFISTFRKFMEGGMVKLGETAINGSKTQDEADAISDSSKFNEAIEKLQNEKSMTYAEAASTLAETNPELFKGYDAEMKGE